MNSNAIEIVFLQTFLITDQCSACFFLHNILLREDSGEDTGDSIVDILVRK